MVLDLGRNSSVAEDLWSSILVETRPERVKNDLLNFTILESL
jgi:hypothetical protein